MLSSAFDLGEHLRLTNLEYSISTVLWNRYPLPSIDLSFNRWNSIKYLNDSISDFHVDIVNVPNDAGGLYLFYVKCPILSGITEYPFYIGRAQITQGQNLRKRVKEYFQKYARDGERPKITKMFKYWSSDLYLAYLPLHQNNDIIDFEKNLINGLLLPMNDQIPEKEIRDAVKAF